MDSDFCSANRIFCTHTHLCSRQNWRYELPQDAVMQKCILPAKAASDIIFKSNSHKSVESRRFCALIFVLRSFQAAFSLIKTPNTIIQEAIMNQSESGRFLGTEKIPKLMLKFSIPCVLSLLVSALCMVLRRRMRRLSQHLSG